MAHGLGLTPHHDLTLVVVSIVVAGLASYTALALAARIAVSERGARTAWLLGGSVSMGTGIWSMHFVAMLAFTLPVPVRHDLMLLALSLVVAMAASGLALFILQRDLVSPSTYAGGALTMGAAIAGMHDLGMRGMLVPLGMTYSRSLVALSIFIAVVASGAALRIAHGLRAPNAPWRLRGECRGHGRRHCGDALYRAWRQRSSPRLSHTTNTPRSGPSMGISCTGP